MRQYCHGSVDTTEVATCIDAECRFCCVGGRSYKDCTRSGKALSRGKRSSRVDPMPFQRPRRSRESLDLKTMATFPPLSLPPYASPFLSMSVREVQSSLPSHPVTPRSSIAIISSLCLVSFPRRTCSCPQAAHPQPHGSSS